MNAATIKSVENKDTVDIVYSFTNSVELTITRDGSILASIMINRKKFNQTVKILSE